MTPLLELYRRLDLLQRSTRFRIVASIVVLVGCGALFGALLHTSYDLNAQRRALVTALTGQNLPEGDEHAVSLSRTGTVVVDGRTYGGESYQRRAEVFFDAQGNIAQPGRLAERMLDDQRPAWAPRWMLQRPGTTWMLAVLATGWLLLIIWLSITLPFVLTLAGTALAASLALLAGSTQAMLAFAGIGLLTFSYIVLTRLALLVLNRPHQIPAVAHTVIKEASRTRLSLVFVVLLLVILPLLPLALDPASPLRYQVQTFISRSMGWTFAVAAGLTLFLSCSTVAFEIRDRQIWQVVTKPVHRFNYLLGKWLGVVTVNLILLVVSGVSIFTFVQYLRERPVAAGAQGQLDAMAVENEILTARRARVPDYRLLDAQQLAAREEQEIGRREELMLLEEVSASRRRALREEIQNGFLLAQRTVPPGAGREYTFSGLEPARASRDNLTLRYRFHILRSDEHETYQAVFQFNDDPNLRVVQQYVPTMSHVIPIPPQLVREDGTLKVTLFNAYMPSPENPGLGALNFEIDDFELLYRVGEFETNFARAVLINWVKLAFLAMLGVACATFLSFPVACLLSFTIFIAGLLGPFLADALGQWAPPATSQMDWGNVGMVVQWAFQWFIKAIAEALVWALRGFGEISATQRLVEGRFISWGDVGAGFGKLVVLWSGIALLIGWLVMRARQLAIYSGHG